VKRAAILILLALGACIDTNGDAPDACPSESVFTGTSPDGGPHTAAVSEYMARRCGTLDCHGRVERPLRLYGQYGLRTPAENNVSGGKATTTAELKANYVAACGLEPEKTAAAVKNLGQSAELLLLVQKARGVEGHKGGAVVTAGGPGDRCIVGWLRGDDPSVVSAACQEALDGL
jgi:hypothetical protein